MDYGQVGRRCRRLLTFKKGRMKIFEIEAAWKDCGTTFSALVAEADHAPEGWDDDEIFFYGLGEADLFDAVRSGADTVHDFIVKGFSEYCYA